MDNQGNTPKEVFMRIILLMTAMLSTMAQARFVDVVQTVDGPKATGYHGLSEDGDIAGLPYEGVSLRSFEALPESFDWRNTPGALTPIKDQGSCGSCYSFAITGALESAMSIFGKQPDLNLSEQQIVSCSDAYACGGGYMTTASYVVDVGLTEETNFPYVARGVRCKSRLPIKAKAVSYKLLGDGNRSPSKEEIKAALVEKGPLFITVMAGGSGWSGSGKSVTSCRRRGGTNHMIILTGWDKDGWIIRNSWGKNWGDKGYAHIGFGCDLVAEQAGYVTVSP